MNQKTERMQLESLNFHHLRYFWCVAKAGHLNRVARQLHVSQSALSAQIRQLKQAVGEPLFEREGRRLKLTDTGHIVLGYAENIFSVGAELVERLKGRDHGKVRLRVGSVATMSRNYQENWLRPLLSDASLSLTLESGLLEGLLDRLLHHQLDVVLANESIPANPDHNLRSRLLGTQNMSLVGDAKVWKTKKLRIPYDLHNLEMALPGPRHAVRAQFDAICGTAGISPRVRAEVDDMAMLRLIARDSGWLCRRPRREPGVKFLRCRKSHQTGL
jgi:LysR family transcriptional activator of nhaA